MKQNIQESALETGLSNHSKTKIKKSPSIVIALAFIVLVFDGYDLVVYGTIVKSILAYEAPLPRESLRVVLPRANPFAWFYPARIPSRGSTI